MTRSHLPSRSATRLAQTWPLMSKPILLVHGLIAAAVTLCAFRVPAQEVPQGQVQPQRPDALQRLSTPRNSASQRYEINQTFGGQAYAKDNNIWVYEKDFADLFGMPVKHIEGLQGAAAAAFRIEVAPYKECGFGGRDEACAEIRYCYLDLYFDESKTPLPWATPETRHDFVPRTISTWWLRPLDEKEKPRGMGVPDDPPGIKRQVWDIAPLIAFADPNSRQPARFTSNQDYDKAGPEDRSTGMPINGYARQFYRTLSLVSLSMTCSVVKHGAVNVSLDARDGPLGPALARFNRITLPEGFVQRIKDMLAEDKRRRSEFYRSLFAPPLGTQGPAPAASRPDPSNQPKH
ncbi:MAG: hypothetical protein LKCHEGNO_01917 [Burkholderiaceae bacterium]|nr:hypothetical protein [Burkholderiaceae bacterium]